jgi:hypothetical protein
MIITVMILLFVVFKMILIRRRRLQADEWLNENQARLVEYVNMKPTETETITNVLE